MHERLGKILRIVGILFFAITTFMNVLGGIGTTCAAFLTEQYPNYIALIDQGLQWLYQALVVATVAIGLVGIWVIIGLIRDKQNAYRNALIVLVLGTIVAGIQYYSSQELFGKAAPANMKFYFNAATLVLFLIFSIPGINQRVNYAREGKTQGKDSTGALAAVSLGIFILLTPAWAGPSHTFQGENWVDLLRTELNLSGGILLGQGALLVARDLVGLCRGGSLVPTIRILMRS